jgi:phospho-N-acetylmuramoyl-pentapeptide-transferase
VRRGLVFSDQAMLLFLGVGVMATLGFIDDFIKVTVRRNRGVFWKKKGVITLVLAGVVATLFTVVTDVDTRIGFTRADLPGWEVPTVVWIVFAALVIFATTNAVNVTDGLDGLAAGSSIFGFVAFGAIAYWGFRNPALYESLVNPLDLAVAAVAFAGACAGFLWWNAAPARVFMGDVGALGLGAALALLALTTNTVLLLPLIGGIFVMEIGSVAVQMTVFRLSGRKKRLFRMSPIHHHFELGGWPETTVIIRFWLISGICVAAALALYIADFTRNANP